MFGLRRIRLCTVNHKEIFLEKQSKRLRGWKFAQHMKQAQAMAKVVASYELGREHLVNSGVLTNSEAERWKAIDEKLIALQENTKELMWHSHRRITREYASSPDGLGKFPRSTPS